MSAVHLIGDSHTQALGPRLRALFPEHTFIYQAFPGKGTEAVRNLAQIPSRADVVAVSLGGNDFGDQSRARTTLVETLRRASPDAELIWLGPFAALDPAVKRRHDQQAEAQRLQIPALDVLWVDTRPWSATGHAPDGVHFTGRGYDRISEQARSVLAAAVRSPVATGGIFTAALLAAAALWWFLRRRSA